MASALPVFMVLPSCPGLGALPNLPHAFFFRLRFNCLSCSGLQAGQFPGSQGLSLSGWLFLAVGSAAQAELRVNLV